MNLIAAVDNNNGIGYRGGLIYSLPDDLRRFKQLTENKIVVMGSGTLKSLPNSKPLKNRVNIVLSRSMTADGIIVCGSVTELLSVIAKYDTDDVFVIGGESVYRQLEKYCARAYITRVDAVSDKADRFFPDLKNGGWTLASRSAVTEHDGVRYAYEEYRKTVDKITEE